MYIQLGSVQCIYASALCAQLHQWESNDSVCVHACMHKHVSVGLSVFVLYVILCYTVEPLYSGHHWDPAGCPV